MADSNDVEIESDIPISKHGEGGSHGRTGNKYYAALRTLKDWESIFIPEAEIPTGVNGTLQYYRLRYGKKHTTRRVKGGLRIWRTE